MASDPVDDPGEGEPSPPSRPPLLLELARGFVVLPRHEQEAFGELVRVLAAAGAGPEQGLDPLPFGAVRVEHERAPERNAVLVAYLVGLARRRRMRQPAAAGRGNSPGLS